MEGQLSQTGEERGAGWVLFAAMVMVVVGGWGIIEGLFALIDDTKVASMGGQIFMVDITTWGWMHIILGGLVLLTGLGLFAGSGAAQVAAIFIVSINAIGQVFTISVYPWWGITLLALDIFILWALCVYRPAKIE
jgi:hypothetical protein